MSHSLNETNGTTFSVLDSKGLVNETELINATNDILDKHAIEKKMKNTQFQASNLKMKGKTIASNWRRNLNYLVLFCLTLR